MSDNPVLRALNTEIKRLERKAARLRAQLEEQPYVALLELQRRLPELMARVKDDPKGVLDELDKMQAKEKELRAAADKRSRNYIKWMDEEHAVRMDIEFLSREVERINFLEGLRGAGVGK